MNNCWFRLRCSCGAAWHWYGREAEASMLERLWRSSHKGSGHAVTVLEGQRRGF